MPSPNPPESTTMWFWKSKVADALFSMMRGGLARWTSGRRMTLKIINFFAGMGPEPLSNAFNAQHLMEEFAGRKTSLKAALLDQRRIAGLGNIYVCEALFGAKLSPLRAAGGINSKDCNRLTTVIRDVLTVAIEAGGSSLRDFHGASGELGYFQHAFKVYDREGSACPRSRCSGKIQRIVQSARSTYYCPKCQI